MPNEMENQIVSIPVRLLYTHPDNPRKELGDLSELAESIRANGILQNLTVVEGHGESVDGFTVIIGHRRLAAAKLAGLEELPCVVREMDHEEQVRTMLMENMQRADLTVYEQAQGFQMMLDLGDSVEDIARKSGFSQSTVRRRVKLLELDQEKFKASVQRGALLQDYAELDKISDPELKNEVLDAIGTNNFKYRLGQAIDTEKRREKMAQVENALQTFAVRIEEKVPETMEYVQGYTSYQPIKEVSVPEDAGEAKYFYHVTEQSNWISIELYREKDPDEQEAENTAEQERERLQEEHKKHMAVLEEASERAYELRKQFVKDCSAADCTAHEGEIVSFLARQAQERPYIDVDWEIMGELLEVEVDSENEEFPLDSFEELASRKPAKALLYLVYALFDNDNHDYIGSSWDKTARCQRAVHEENEGLSALYKLLTAIGYEMSDEEKALQDGTHDMFEVADDEDD